MGVNIGPAGVLKVSPEFEKMKPMLEFTSLPPRAEEKPRRRRRKVKSPENPKVRCVMLAGLFNQPNGRQDADLMNGAKWVSK